MRVFALLLPLAGLVSASAASADPRAEEAMCEALGAWTPVHLPQAGVDAATPCDEAAISAFRSADARRRVDGVVGCEVGGRSFVVIYAVNAPAGYFDNIVADTREPTRSTFSVAGHRVMRRADAANGKFSAEQIIEIDASRVIIMTVSAPIASGNDTKVTSCFFNSFEFGNR